MPGATPHFGFPFQLGGDPPDGPNLGEDLAQAVEDAMEIRSAGKSIIAAEQTTPSASFAYLGTPDRVQNLVAPTGGLVLVLFQASATYDGGVGEAQIQASSGDGGVVSGGSAIAPVGKSGPVAGQLVTTALGLSLLDAIASNAGPAPLFLQVTTGGTFEVGVKFRKGGALVGAGASLRRLQALSLGF